MEEGAVVVARGQGPVHFLQPHPGVVGGAGALRCRGEQQAGHGAGNEPRRPNGRPTRHGATRVSGDRFPGGWSLTARPLDAAAAAAAAAPASSSALESRSFRTSFCPRTEEYLLWANT